jgi:hypothetical protein
MNLEAGRESDGASGDSLNCGIFRQSGFVHRTVSSISRLRRIIVPGFSALRN